MSNEPELPTSDDEIDPDTVTTPGGQVGELKGLAEETDAEVAPDAD